MHMWRLPLRFRILSGLYDKQTMVIRCKADPPNQSFAEVHGHSLRWMYGSMTLAAVPNKYESQAAHQGGITLTLILILTRSRLRP